MLSDRDTGIGAIRLSAERRMEWGVVVKER